MTPGLTMRLALRNARTARQRGYGKRGVARCRKSKGKGNTDTGSGSYGTVGKGVGLRVRGVVPVECAPSEQIKVRRERLRMQYTCIKDKRAGARRRAFMRAARREANKMAAFQKEFDARRLEVRRLAAEFPLDQKTVVPFTVNRPLRPWETRGARPELRGTVVKACPRQPTSRRSRIAVIAMRSGGERAARICARQWGPEFAYRWDPKWGYDDGG